MWENDTHEVTYSPEYNSSDLNYNTNFLRRLGNVSLSQIQQHVCASPEKYEGWYERLCVAANTTGYPETRNETFQGDIWAYLEKHFAPRRGELTIAVLITSIYALIFLSGIIGNVCTCIVIAKNKYMHTATNYYLFNLAIADLLLLIIGLPPETFLIWSAYPWVFGEAFCIVRVMLAEMSTNASILTITAFTMERYFAICHPMEAHTMSGLKRVVKVILVIWSVASFLSIPASAQFQIVYNQDGRGRDIIESAYCGIKEKNYIERIFEISTFIFFVLPMIVLTTMYTLIAIEIQKSGLVREGSDTSCARDRLTGKGGLAIRVQQQARARRSVVKMLAAVVVAFFFCWAPFHTQRMMTLYIPASQWTASLLATHNVVYYISGVCYFLSCTINPILYSIMSIKFRQAFKQTFLNSECCKCRVRKSPSRPYLSYRFSHRNGYSETSFTSVDHASPARNHASNHPHPSRRQSSPADGAHGKGSVVKYHRGSHVQINLLPQAHGLIKGPEVKKVSNDSLSTADNHVAEKDHAEPGEHEELISKEDETN